MLQTNLKKGLYDAVGGRIDEPYNLPSKNDPQKHEAIWKFASTGELESVTQTNDSVLTDAEYFVPIKSISKIANDMLVIGLEGTSLKQRLPEVRWGSKVPFTF